MGKTWQRILILVLAFALAVAGTFMFAFRAGRRARQIHAENEPIRAWMSVPFVAHTHHVPASALFQALGVEPLQPRDRRSIRHLARDLKRPVPDLIAQLQHAIDANKRDATKHPPGGPSQ